MQRGSFSSARSGGDALKQRDSGRAPLQHRDEKACKLNWNAGNEGVKVDRHGAGQTDWIDKIASCPVYYPTEEEFTDPLHYIQKIASEASEYGICKIVSPVVASVPAGVVLTKEQTNFKFTTRVQPMRLSNWDKDDKTTFPMSGRLYTLTEYEKVANKAFARKFSTAAALPTKFVEVEFWKELVSGKTQTVEYASDVEGSAFSGSCMDPLGQSKWNLKGISRLPDSTLRLLEIVIPGVTEPMLYIGMLFSMFAWHIEDHYLYSINYHHFGAPKTWYGVPGKSAPDFEQIVERHVYETEMLKDSGKGSQYDLLLGKTTMFAPKLLSEHGVPVYRAVQNPGEYVVTFPRAYHAGFSHGFNCGEAVNFAMADWFPFGAVACSRYEYLNRIPLLPHEELLCTEAMMISQLGSNPCDSRTYRQQNHVKVAFVTLMRSQLQAYEHFKKQGVKSTTSSSMNVLCGLCKHPCYIAYTECNCFPEPTCLNHERVVSACTCGIARSLVVRDDLTTLQEVAQTYELEAEILSEVLKGSSIYDSLLDGAGSGVGEEEYLFSRALLSGPEAINGSNEVSLSGEKRHNLLEGDGVLSAKSKTGVTSLDSKQDQEEDSSDSEAFRVKRRRLLPSRSKRFQVDEQVLSPKKLLINGMAVGSGNEKQGNSEAIMKEKRLEPAIKQHPLLVQDVMKALGIKGSIGEVIRRWQHDARRQGITIKVKQIPFADRLVEAISLKSCMYLKQLLTEGQSRRLEMLMRQVKQPSLLTVNSSCSIQGNIEPTTSMFQVKKNAVSAGKKDAHKSVDGSVSDNRKVLQQENDAVDSPGLLKEVAASNRKHCSLPSKVNVCKNGMLGRRKRDTENETLFPEGSSNNTELQCRKQIQKVSRLKVKGPTPPALSDGILSMVKEAGQVEGGTSRFRAHTGKSGNRSEQCYVGLDECKQPSGVVLKDEREVTAERKVIKEHRNVRTEATLGSEPSKILIVHLNRKIDQHGGSVASCSADSKNKPEEKRDRRMGSVLQEADTRDAREAVSASTAGSGSLEHQTVDLLGNSSVSSWHAPMAAFSNSPEVFNSPKESDLQLGSVLDDGDAREEFRETRNHVGLQHAADLLSQGFEQTSEKFSSKSVARKSSARESKIAAGGIKTPVVDRVEQHGMVDHMLSSVFEDKNRQSGGGAKEQLESGIYSFRCNRKGHHPLSLTENGSASHSQHAQEYHQQANDGFSRRFWPEKNRSRDVARAVSGTRAHSPPGEIHFRRETPKDEAGSDEEAGLGKNSGWRVSGQVQRSSSVPRSPSVSDKLRGTTNDNLRYGSPSRTASEKNPSCTSKSSLHSHRYSHRDNARISKDPRFCHGQEIMQQQSCGPHRYWNVGLQREGEFHADNARLKGGFDRLEGEVADKQGGSCRDEAGDDRGFSSKQNCLKYSSPRSGRTV